MKTPDLPTRYDTHIPRAFRIAALAAGLAGAWALPALALRPDRPAASRAAPAAAAAEARTPTADQRDAARSAVAAGLRIRWQDGLGTPALVRAPNREAADLFSVGAKPQGRGREGDPLAVLDNLSRLYRIGNATQEFAPHREELDQLGFRHARLRQRYQGMNVVGGELTVHFDRRGKPYQVNGRYVPDIAVAVAPVLTAAQATELAAADLAGLGVPAGRTADGPTLCVFALHTTPTLAYQLVLHYRDVRAGSGRWRYWVDAVTGAILLRFNDVPAVPAPATGAPAGVTGSILGGEGGGATSVTAWREQTGLFYLHNAMEWWHVYNVASGGYPDAGTYGWRPASDWAQSDRAEMSLARNFGITQRFFRDVFGRQSFDDLGIPARANAHEGIAYPNAYWDGTAFYFGDGDGVIANALATLDICGHEFTHAVTEYTSALIYAGESGVLNESFSDILAACIEFAAQPDGRSLYPSKQPGRADWLIGEDSWVAASALRDMRNPGNAATVGSAGRQPSRYQGTFWDPNNEVHQNSGVQNFFFYLLSEGGSGSNDGIGYSVAGIGSANAAQVAYRALTAYCSPCTDHRAVRDAWSAAAADLNTNWVASVAAAWNAVGVSHLTIRPTDRIVFRGPLGGPFARVSQPLTLMNAEGDAVAWSASHSQPWLNAEAAGTVPGGGASVPAISVNSTAHALGRGTYTDTLVISNRTDGAWQTRQVVLQVGLKDFFTELFPKDWEQDPQQHHLNDLAYSTLTFTPDSSVAHAQSFYRANRDPATAFPSATGGNAITFGSDGLNNQSVRVDLTGGKQVWLYGVPYTSFYIGSRGYITFGSADNNYMESFAAHFDRPRISALFKAIDHLDGTRTWAQLADRVVVTFQNIRAEVPNARCNFQYELFFNGTIRLTYLELGTRGGLVGLSNGGGVPVDFVESDLSAYGPYTGPADSPDALIVQPFGGLPASGPAGGPFSPNQIVYTLSNAGAAPLVWSAVKDQNWVQLSAAGGTLPAGGSASVTVSLSASAAILGAGSYASTVAFSNVTSNARRTRAVTLEVASLAGNVQLLDSLAPAGDGKMTFGPHILGVSATEHVTVTNTDAASPLLISGIALQTGTYAEDFNDGLAQGWTEGLESNWRIDAGEYRARGAVNDYMVTTYGGQVWSNVAVQAQWQWTDGRVGAGAMLLRASPDFDLDTGSAYGFQIRGSQISVYKQVAGLLLWLQEWQTTQAILTGVNTLTATAQGSSLAFYVNGSLAWSGTDNALASGRIGLGGTITQPQFEQRFDNVKAWKALPQPFPSAVPVTPVFSLSSLPALPLTLGPRQAATFNITYLPTRRGTDFDTLALLSNDADTPELRVALSGEGVADSLRVAPEASLAISGHPGGPFTPAAALFALSNAAPGSVSWTAASGAGWLNVSPASGTLAPGQTAAVTAAPNGAAAALAAGEYAATVTFCNLTTTGVTTREVRLSVFTSPRLTLTPPALVVTNVLGGNSQRTLSIGNGTGADAALSFQLLARETARVLTESDPGTPRAVRDFTQPVAGAAFRPDRLLVRFRGEQTAAGRAGLLAQMGAAGIAAEFKQVSGLCLVRLAAGWTVEQALAAWNGMPGILYAEPDYEVRGSFVPNDPRFPQLWGLSNTGQNVGTPDADIDAPEAWNTQTGSRSVVVGVIDSGVDYGHEDLAANLWRNPGEIAGNGIDDDGNGYADDVYGINAVAGSGDPMDDYGHGTHCAGTIAAVGNNGVGVAGVCWSGRIMALKFLGADGRGYSSGAIACIEYAIANGAKVLNCSWGGYGYQQALKDAFDAAGAAGIVVSAAAGNDSTNMDEAGAEVSYPAGFDSPNILSVMASDQRDAAAAFSNYGLESVDLAAPGTLIVSTRAGGGYLYMDGTSMAAPHVAGACALLLSQNSLLSAAAIKSALLSTVDVPATPLECVSGGRLNVARALTQAGALWLSATPTSAAGIAAGAAAAVSVRFDAVGLLAGAYDGELVVMSNDRTTPQTNVTCRMIVPADRLGISPVAGLAASGPRGGPFTPDSRVYTVTNRSASAIHWTTELAHDWAEATPSSGTLQPGAAVTVTARLTRVAHTLQAGAYEQALVVVNADSGARQQRPVSVYVTPILNEDDLVISPADEAAFEGPVGGPFTPANAVCRLVNVSQESLAWTAQSTRGWLLLAPESGELQPGEAAFVTVWLDAAATAPFTDGVYPARVDFLNEYSGMGQSRNVSLTAKAHPIVPFGPGVPNGASGVPVAATLSWNDTGATSLAYGPTRSALDVLVCATYQPAMEDIKAKLMAAGQFRSVVSIDPRQQQPTLAELRAFDAVLVSAGDGYTDSTAWGDMLADYVDGGGGVVCMLKECTDTYMGGRWLAQSYRTIPQGAMAWGPATLGSVQQPLHPIMWGVASFRGGTQSWRPSSTSILTGSTRIADWSDGKPLVVTRSVNGHPRADLCFYPASSDLNGGTPAFWDATSDGGRLMANAIRYVGEAVYAYGCVFDVYLDVVSPPTRCLVAGTKKTQARAVALAPNTTYYWRVRASNDVSAVWGPVWSFTTGNGPNPLPYAESFETYAPGQALAGSHGWYAVNPAAAAVSADAEALQAEAGYSAACGFPLAAGRTRVLRLADAAEVALVAPPRTALLIDFMARFPLCNETLVPPTVRADDVLGLTARLNGRLAVRHRRLDAGTNAWTELNRTIEAGRWYRVTVRMDYGTTNPVYGMGYFQVDVDGQTVSNAAAYSTNDGSGTPGGTWFAAASASNTLSRLAFGAGADVDDISIGTSNPHHRLAPRGTPEWWLIEHGLTGTPAAAEAGDADGDGMQAWEEFVAGTDPTNSASVFRLTGIQTGARIPLRFDSVPGRRYRINVATNLVRGGWRAAPFATTADGALGTDPMTATGSTAVIYVAPGAGPEYYRGGVER